MQEPFGTEVNYESIRMRNLRSASTLRVLGVPVGDRIEGYVTVLWCGIGIDGEEHREPSERILHLAQGDISATGEMADFRVGGTAVRWYDLRKDATAVEETYTPVALMHVARMRVGGRGRWGFPGETVPITIEPTTTTLTGAPPTTLSP